MTASRRARALKALALWSMAVGVVPSPRVEAGDFHLDCAAKGDEGSGALPGEAWKTLDRANRATFAPGDRLLLRSGCVFTGTLSPQGSGEPGRPILIDRYGTGALPRIDGNGAMAAVLLKDQQYWEIANLKITNSAGTPGLRRGVLVVSERAGVLSHIHLRDLEVTDVAGQLGADMVSKRTGGIGIEARGVEQAGRFDDLRIERCRVERVDNVGIYLWSEPGPHPRHPRWAELRFTNVVVRGNRLDDIGKNAIVVRASEAPLIEGNLVARAASRLHGNAIYVFGSKNALIQGNEVHHTRYDGLEGAAYDSDFNSEGTIIQYNYSHENGGGLANICASPPRGYNDGTIIRYNVSRDETDRVIAFDGPATNTLIHNNTVFVSKGLAPRIVEFDVFGKSLGYADRVRIVNNIFVNEGAGTYVKGQATNVSFEANCFAGSHPLSEPEDPRKETGAPKFADPGSVASGIASTAGYRLLPGSPCAASGIPIRPRPERDLLGVPVPEIADRGALQSPPLRRP